MVLPTLTLLGFIPSQLGFLNCLDMFLPSVLLLRFSINFPMTRDLLLAFTRDSPVWDEELNMARDVRRQCPVQHTVQGVGGRC